MYDYDDQYILNKNKKKRLQTNHEPHESFLCLLLY